LQQGERFTVRKSIESTNGANGSPGFPYMIECRDVV
jgi:hypothetical protein